jgi:hypothetical protein
MLNASGGSPLSRIRQIALVIDCQYTTGKQVYIPIDVYGEEENQKPKWGLDCQDAMPPKGYWPSQFCEDLTRNVMQGKYYATYHETYDAFLECLDRLKTQYPMAVIGTHYFEEWTVNNLLALAENSIQQVLDGKEPSGVHYFVRWQLFLNQCEDREGLVDFVRKVAAKYGFIALPLHKNWKEYLAFVGKKTLIQVQRHHHLIPAIEYLL